MSIFRSERMSLWQMILQNESAYNCVAEMGELGIVEFRDLNPELTAFQRTFSREIKRCDEMERKLRYIDSEISKEGMKTEELDTMPPVPQPKEMIDLEAALDKMDQELREINGNADALKKNYLSLTEMKLTLKYAENFLGKMGGFNDSTPRPTMKTAEGMEEGIAAQSQQQNMQRFRFVTGVVNQDKVAGFERMLWRASRGNVFFRTVPIEDELEDPMNGAKLSKSVFIAFYQGDQLKSRVKKICEGYHASIYPCPEGEAQRKETAIGVAARIEDLNTVLLQTKDHRSRVLKAAAKHLRNWTVKVRKIKGVYHTMNMMSVDVTSKALVAECWIPDDDTDAVNEALKHGSKMSDSAFLPILNMLTTNEEPPTFFRTNKFTAGFQTLVNAYGMAAYREVNPGLYTIITFPFLFAVMFGDAGHALIVTIFATYLILQEEKLAKVKEEVFSIIFGGRYIILLMGLFSLYTGLIYNDIFAKSFNIFGSAWRVRYSNETIMDNEHIMMDPKQGNCTCCPGPECFDTECCGHYRGDPYPFGLDPVWVVSDNKIVYLNSYKMKLSIILGVFHMTFGVFLNLWNFTYFKNYPAILLEFLPRVLFFWPLFGYMMFLMWLKWIKYGANMDTRELQSDCAPSILITFINMMLLAYSEDKLIPPNPDCKTVWFFGANGEPNESGIIIDGYQPTIQKVFLLVALLSVPVLLFGTPIRFKMNQNKEKRKASYSTNSGSQSAGEDQEPIVSTQTVNKGSDSHDEHGGSFGDVMIYQAIHTIEYVLESISHTASYLRLWALSLAHSQLSEVLWFMVLRIGFTALPGYGGSVILFLTFGFWCGATVAILIAMEGMSAFLHTLRLHWVEFQSKFYKGTGVKFHAFHFRRVSDDARDE